MATLFDEEISLPPMRGWQKETMPKIKESLAQGSKLLLCVPTGAGKTMMSAYVIHDYTSQFKRVMFVVDRLVLIEQTKNAFMRLGLDDIDILQGQNSTYTNAPIVIASQQTLIRRDMPKNLSLICVDEAHVLSKDMENIIKESQIPVLGLSATPFRDGLGTIFNDLMNPVTTRQLTQDGVLVSLTVKQCKKINMIGAKKVKGEYKDTDVEERAKDIVGDVVKEYKNHANNKAIAFCATINQCQALADEFNNNGVPAVIFCATTTPVERAEILEKYNNSDDIMILISVFALATGFDSPRVRTVLDCRPLSRSLSLYIQGIGRGLRSMPGKTECLLLDFTGNVTRFLDDFVDFYENGIASLDDGERLDKPRKEINENKKKKKESKGCPKCKSMLFLNGKCLSCGFVIPKSNDMFETQKNNYEVVRLDIFACETQESKKYLWQEICNFVHRNTNHNFFDMTKSRKRANAIYNSLSGKWANKKWEFLPNGTKVDPRVETEIVKQQQEYKARKAQEQYNNFTRGY